MQRTLWHKRGQGGGHSDKIGDSVEKIVDLEQEIEKQYLLLQKDKVINQIQGSLKVKYIDLLFKRYIQYKDFKQISKEMDISYAYALEFHKKALKEFEKVHVDFLESMDKESTVI